ncbi:MAG: tryptophan halogenase family protein [Terricaulis sp.]
MAKAKQQKREKPPAAGGADRRIRSVLIVGGGTAGWMSAAALSRKLGRRVSIRLVESAEIGIVGVGEATVPHIRYFNTTLGLDEADFMRKTQATIKLGIKFANWARVGDAYIHPFGEFGSRINDVDFHHYWVKLRQLGDDIDLFDHSLPVVAAELGKFMLPAMDRSIFSTFGYAYHFDTNLYGPYLRSYAEARGVVRTEGRVVDVTLRGEDGYVQSVTMANGEVIEADLFVDCSGFRGLIIEQKLKAGYLDWTNYLPCNRAVAVASAYDGPPMPYTKATAYEAGWQWRIPLQHRDGNGYVYSSEFISDDEAAANFLSRLPGKPLTDPLFLRFTGGHRKKTWIKNCVSVGLAGGFIEPLESTSIYLTQQAITALLELFPTRDFEASTIEELNRVMDMEYERVLDFVALHYHATERDDTPMWNYVRNMRIPDTLAYALRLFKERGHVVKYKDGMFLEPSWHAVYFGQRVMPARYDPRVDALDVDQLREQMRRIRTAVRRAAEMMPTHQSFLDDHGAAIALAERVKQRVAELTAE